MRAGKMGPTHVELRAGHLHVYETAIVLRRERQLEIRFGRNDIDVTSNKRLRDDEDTLADAFDGLTLCSLLRTPRNVHRSVVTIVVVCDPHPRKTSKESSKEAQCQPPQAVPARQSSH